MQIMHAKWHNQNSAMFVMGMRKSAVDVTWSFASATTWCN